VNLILGWLRAFGRFWYGFIVGDDWTLAATVVVALVATWWLHTAGIAAWWVVPFAAAGALGVSLGRAGA
jgi:hypothetical protein